MQGVRKATGDRPWLKAEVLHFPRDGVALHGMVRVEEDLQMRNQEWLAENSQPNYDTTSQNGSSYRLEGMNLRCPWQVTVLFLCEPASRLEQVSLPEHLTYSMSLRQVRRSSLSWPKVLPMYPKYGGLSSNRLYQISIRGQLCARVPEMLDKQECRRGSFQR